MTLVRGISWGARVASKHRWGRRGRSPLQAAKSAEQWAPWREVEETERWPIGHVLRQRAVKKPYPGVFPYMLVERRPYVGRDGEAWVRLTWEARCPICDLPFWQYSGPKVGTLVRGCRKHRPWYQWRRVTWRLEELEDRGEQLRILIDEVEAGDAEVIDVIAAVLAAPDLRHVAVLSR